MIICSTIIIRYYDDDLLLLFILILFFSIIIISSSSSSSSHNLNYSRDSIRIEGEREKKNILIIKYFYTYYYHYQHQNTTRPPLKDGKGNLPITYCTKNVLDGIFPSDAPKSFLAQRRTFLWFVQCRQQCPIGQRKSIVRWCYDHSGFPIELKGLPYTLTALLTVLYLRRKNRNIGNRRDRTVSPRRSGVVDTRNGLTQSKQVFLGILQCSSVRRKHKHAGMKEEEEEKELCGTMLRYWVWGQNTKQTSS